MNVCPECGQAFSEGGFCTQDGVPLVAGGEDPLLGAMLGPYRVAQVIGVGGMGRVYKGINPTIRSRVAIKVLSHDCADRPELVERFFAEARAVNLIRHESIVNILDLDRLADGRPYIVMEFLDGQVFSDLLSKRGRLAPGTLTRLMVEVLTALGAAHAKGVVHRDLKPDNIFVTRHGRAKILDFGVAKLASEQREGSSATRAGSLIGTPHYMSPEQALSKPIDARADIYAIGVILYEAATGRRPLDGGSVFEILRKQVDDEPLPPRRFAPELPPAYERLILKAMAKEPAKRWQSADELARGLIEASAGLTPEYWEELGDRAHLDRVGLPTPPTAPQRRPPVARRRSRAPLLVAAATALAGAAVAGILVAQRAEEVGPQQATLSSAQIQDAAATPSGADTPAAAATQETAPRPDQSTKSPGADAAALEESPMPKEESAVAQMASSPGDSTSLAQRKPARSGKRGGGPGKEASRIAASEAGEAPTSAPPAGGPVREEKRSSGGDETADRARSALPKSPDLPREQPNRKPSSWDVTGYLPQALARARAQFPDAVLSRIDADGVYPSGKADLTLDDGYSVLYRFRSGSRAKRPATLPQGVKHKPTCLFYVLVNHDSISSYPLEGWTCDNQPAIRMPRCSVKEVWRRAAAAGAPTDNAVGTLSYRLNSEGKPQWWFSIGGEHQHDFVDDC
jgi:serine/threonine-protein kinase